MGTIRVKRGQLTHGRDALARKVAALVINLAALDLVGAAVGRAEAGALVLDHDLLAWRKEEPVRQLTTDQEIYSIMKHDFSNLINAFKDLSFAILMLIS